MPTNNPRASRPDTIPATSRKAGERAGAGFAFTGRVVLEPEVARSASRR